LSGEFFDGPPAPDKGWHEDERAARGYDSADSDSKSNEEDSDAGHGHGPGHASGPPQTASIGMGPGRTGVKGVIRDRNEATSLERARRAKAVDEMNRRMEKASLGGKTFLEDSEEDGAMGGERRLRMALEATRKTRKFGHLREVGVDGFVSAVEEERGVWVVVHLYEPVRCLFFSPSLISWFSVYHDSRWKDVLRWMIPLLI
jgi:hypothetical protein